MAEKTLSDEEKKKLETMNKNREISLKLVGSSLWNYALPRLISSEAYGQYASLAKQKFVETLSKAPDQTAYENLFLPQYLQKAQDKEGNEGIELNDTPIVPNKYIQERSIGLLQDAFKTLKVDDLAQFVKDLKIGDQYKGKYISEVDEKVAEQLIGGAFTYKIETKVKELVDMKLGMLKGGLEKILTEPKEEKK